MSKKITIGKRDTSKAIGLILLDLPAKVMTPDEIMEWSAKFNEHNPGQFLFDGILMMSSLTPGGYTLWKGLTQI